MLESNTEPEQLDLETVKDEIRKNIVKAKEQIAYVKKMDALMKDAKITRVPVSLKLGIRVSVVILI